MNELTFGYDTILRLSYDLLSLLLSVFVLIYTIRIRTLTTFRNRVFLVYVLTVLTMCVVDAAQYIVSITLPKASIANLILDCFYCSLVVFIPVTFLIYVFALVDYFQMVKDESKNMLPFRIFFPISVGLFFIWASVFYGGSYRIFEYLNSFVSAKRGVFASVKGLTGYIIEFFIAYYYIVFGVIIMIEHKYRLEKNTFTLMVFVFFALNAAVIIQIIHPEIRLETLSFSFSLVIFSLFVQKPDYLKSSRTEVLNSKAFDVIVSDYLLHKYNFKVILLYMEDTVFYHDILGQSELNEFETSIVRKLRVLFRDTPILRDEAHGFYYLLFKNASNQDVEQSLSALDEQIKNRWGYGGLRFDFTFRICVVDGQTDIKTVSDLRNFAAVFAKQDIYKGQCIRANEIDFTNVQRCSNAEQALMSGTFEELVEVLYQPIYSVSEKRITRAESILCFKDDTNTFVTTDTFLPVFERTGHFFNVNAFAFNSVCALLSSEVFPQLGIEKMGINISIIDSTQHDLFEQIKNRFDYYNVSPMLVHFELTQSSYVNAPNIIAKNLQKLSGYGIEIILDNFGIGNSNVAQFVDLSLGMIKLDGNVIQIAWVNSKVGNALKYIVKMAHDLGIQVIANGVETMEQRIWLEGIGCDYLQGSLFGKPLPETEFVNFMHGLSNRAS